MSYLSKENYIKLSHFSMFNSNLKQVEKYSPYSFYLAYV